MPHQIQTAVLPVEDMLQRQEQREVRDTPKVTLGITEQPPQSWDPGFVLPSVPERSRSPGQKPYRDTVPRPHWHRALSFEYSPRPPWDWGSRRKSEAVQMRQAHCS